MHNLVASMDNMYDNMYVSKNKKYRALAAESLAFAKDAVGESRDDVIPQYSAQNDIRSAFGKGVAVPPCIGDHPDFKYLSGSAEIEYCSVATLFIDIESSTRLSLLYPIEDVFKIKNALLCAAIEIIKAFDGHVHRLMGDAVMAYFGGKSVNNENCVIDAINAASVLMFFVENIVQPKLQDKFLENKFGIRIGVDYGGDDDVIWSSYGYPGVSEVTATSFYVDIASKLQSSAGRNEIMLGQNLVEFVDFPSEILATKKRISDGREVDDYYIRPNHTNASGVKINYKKYILNWREYLRCSPMAKYLDKKYEWIPTDARLVKSDGSEELGNYASASYALQKDTDIKFCIKLPIEFKGATADFSVENHGKEAFDKSGADMDNHSTTVSAKKIGNRLEIRRTEHTSYRGLHYCTISVNVYGKKKFESRFGVYVV